MRSGATESTDETTRARLAIVGVGNTLAGNDGVGVRVVEMLHGRGRGSREVLLVTLEGDLFDLEDIARRTGRLIVVDSWVGGEPGEILVEKAPHGSRNSFHQADVSSVLHALEALGHVTPFPDWEVWCIGIPVPDRLEEGLSPEVEIAAIEAADGLEREIDGHLHEQTA